MPQKKKRKPLLAALGDLSSLSASLADAEAAQKVSPKSQRGLGVGGCKQRTRIT